MKNLTIGEIKSIGRVIGVENFGVLKQLYRSVARTSGEEGAKGVKEILAFASGKADKARAKFVVDNNEIVKLIEKFDLAAVPGASEAYERAGMDLGKILKDGLAEIRRLFPKSLGEGATTTATLNAKRYGKSSTVIETFNNIVANGERIEQSMGKVIENPSGKRKIKIGNNLEFGAYHSDSCTAHETYKRGSESLPDALTITSDGIHTSAVLKPYQEGNTRTEGSLTVQRDKLRKFNHIIGAMPGGEDINILNLLLGIS